MIGTLAEITVRPLMKAFKDEFSKCQIKKTMYLFSGFTCFAHGSAQHPQKMNSFCLLINLIEKL
jgi:hypothetical protein